MADDEALSPETFAASVKAAAGAKPKGTLVLSVTDGSVVKVRLPPSLRALWLLCLPPSLMPAGCARRLTRATAPFLSHMCTHARAPPPRRAAPHRARAISRARPAPRWGA